MIVNFVCNDTLNTVILPEKASGQIWLTNSSGHKIVKIEAVNNTWMMKTTSRYVYKIHQKSAAADHPDDIKNGAVLKPHLLILIKCKTSPDERIYIFTEEYTPDRITFRKYSVPEDFTISVGSGRKPKILTFENDYVSTDHAVMRFVNNTWFIKDEGSTNGTFVNGRRIDNTILKYGDTVFIVGLKIIVGNGFLAINNPDGRVKLHSDNFQPFLLPQMDNEADPDDPDENPEEDSFFDRSPRFKREIVKAEIPIDAPPKENAQDEMPVILTVGPAMTMAMASITSGSFAVTNAIASGNVKAAIPTVVMSGSMCLGTLLWPTLTRHYTKKKKRIRENQRRAEYTEYLDSKRQEIQDTCREQRDILNENIISTEECEKRILNVQRNLWERSIGQDDFLSFRIGTGDLPMFGNVQYPARRFSLTKDILEENMLSLCEEPKILKNVPISVSILKEPVGVIGEQKDLQLFLKGVIFQLAALYSYDEVKLVFLYDKADEAEFGFVKWLPHVWNKEKTLRMIATTPEEAKLISSQLERVYSSREQLSDNDLADESPYYVVIALSKNLLNRADAVKNILSSKRNLHMNVLAAVPELRMLPKECASVIELAGLSGRLFNKNDTSGNVVAFTPDLSLTNAPMKLAAQLANIRLDDSDQSTKLPKMLTFLQMFDVGKVEHLNSPVRWKENDPTKSLAAPVGVNPYGDLFEMDLHEKYHGPHGLVAGMTGSGKSEFIITYILSLAVNFHPHEVSFIMIDYKGGGMAKSFENLPHTAGIITNLDGSAIKRSLVSIHSELKRRQKILAEASKLIGESNINIYQYQKLYREHAVAEPLSHLFIIADEFAELKTQQSEFMTELISAARIGRSLGVHLILATQKPSGVVDDQIWSNSRFRVCLKVQERQDSMDMLKRPDAAELADTGRFYLQVGYNELFELGQSAWAGAEYIPSEHTLIEKDNSVDAIDLNGRVMRSVKPKPKHQFSGKQKKQLDAITDYLQQIAKEDHVSARALWLDPIPAYIVVSELKEKYPAEAAACAERFVLDPIIGEYDDPENQSQGLLTLPITADGNVLIYGGAGSGKTTLLYAILSSIMTEHTPEEVNFYLLDFADENLNAFARSPHVGEVMLSNDSEKIARMFKQLYTEIKQRKKKLSMVGQDYNTFMKTHPDADMPALMIVIHNYTAFAELYADHEDDILFLSREGLKYGIYFIMTTLTTNGVRYRITQNFKQHLVLQMNDESEYSTVLGKTDGLFPAKIKGRGLVKRDKLMEFQTAHITRGPSAFEAAQQLCEKLADGWNGKTAERIPILPDTVDADFLAPHLREKQPFLLPVGVDKNTLRVRYYDFSQHCIDLLLSAGEEYISFAGAFLELLLCVPSLHVTVFDAESKLSVDDTVSSRQNFTLLRGAAQCNDGTVKLFDEIVRRNNLTSEARESGKPLPEFEPTLCLIVSMKALSGCLTDDRPERLKLLLEKNETAYRYHILTADSAKDISGYSFNPWYKKHITGIDGIWFGGGASEQYAIKASENAAIMRKPVSAPLGFLFEKGSPSLCKLISESRDEQNG